MKKIVLSLAGVLAATAFAPEAMALPGFARQTGMACTACHFQHFPVLNSFGRAFRASGYTMMGAQGKIEGDHLSIPDTLNAGIILKARYQKSSGTDTATAVSGTTTNGGQWQFPDELGLIFSGRVAENVGMFVEVGLAASASGATQSNPDAGILGGFKMPFIYDVGGAKLGVTPFITDGQGVFFGYDQSSGGLVRAARWAEDRANTSAFNYVNIGNGAATGLAFSASNDMGFLAVSRFTPNHASLNGKSGGVQYRSNALRIAATPTVSDWNMLIGASFLSGTNYKPAIVDPTVALTTAVALQATKGLGLDFQAQGQVAGKDMSVYVNYAKADASTAAQVNIYNANFTDRKAWVAAVDYSVIPHVLTIGAAYLNAKTGQLVAGGTASDKDNAITVTGVYDLYQNVALHLSHAMHSGSSWNTGGTRAGDLVAGKTGKNMTTFMLEAAW